MQTLITHRHPPQFDLGFMRYDYPPLSIIVTAGCVYPVRQHDEQQAQLAIKDRREAYQSALDRRELLLLALLGLPASLLVLALVRWVVDTVTVFN
jgi:hypothetical protein